MCAVVTVSFFGPTGRVGEIIVLKIDSDMNNTPYCRARMIKARCFVLFFVALQQSVPLRFKTKNRKILFVPVASRGVFVSNYARVDRSSKTGRNAHSPVRPVRAPCEADRGDTMSHGQFKFERKSGGVSRKLKQAGNVCKIREFELEKVTYKTRRIRYRVIGGRRVFTPYRLRVH